ncbi:YybH family protein [Algoriphagus sp.]|uniref:YybH family protein n=1 Tax=Algoriphagus sp. TaxID=1872435 RepID=UPI0039187652
MYLNKIFCFALTCLVVLSCTTPESKEDTSTLEPALVSVDSLTDNWNEGWNNKDSASIASMFTETTVVMEGDWIVTGRDSIMEKWVINQMPKMDNFKTDKISSGVTADMAYYTGTYSLDVVNNDSIVGNSQGNFTTLWKKQDDNSWKVELLHMGNLNP